MMSHLGFSYVGFIYLLMLFIPNIMWSKNKPDGYDKLSKKESKLLLLFERSGQICVTFCAVSFSDFNLKAFSLWSIWMFASFSLMILYEICWIRYFKIPNLKSFYGSFLNIPVPLASLPVTAFFLLGVYGKVVWLIFSVIILGIGHIGIHMEHRKRIGC